MCIYIYIYVYTYIYIYIYIYILYVYRHIKVRNIETLQKIINLILFVKGFEFLIITSLY